MLNWEVLGLKRNVLSAKFIRTAPLGEHHDGAGLSLFVQATKRSWLQRYAITRGKRSKKVLGTYPDMSLADARFASEKFRQSIAKGVTAVEAVEEQAMTFEQVMDDWLSVYQSKVAADTAVDARRRLENHVRSIFDMPIGTITGQTLEAALKPLSDSKKFETLKKVADKIRQVMEFAMHKELIDRNPAAYVKKLFQSSRPVKQPTIKPKDLHILFKEVQQSTLTQQSRDLLMLQMLTAVRPGEIVAAKWDNIEGSVLTIDAEHMKGTRFAKRSPDIYLSSVTKELLARQVRNPKSPFIFSLRSKPDKPASSETITAWLRDESSLSGKLVAHGFRSIFSTWANEQRGEHGRLYDKEVIENCLAHGDPDKIRDIYNDAEYEVERLRIMEGWGQFVKSQWQKAVLESSI